MILSALMLTFLSRSYTIDHKRVATSYRAATLFIYSRVFLSMVILGYGLGTPVFPKEPFRARQCNDQEEKPFFVDDRFTFGPRMDNGLYMLILADTVR